MITATTPERTEIDEASKWDLSVMYDSAEAWNSHALELSTLVRQFAERKGLSGKSPEDLLVTLKLRDRLQVEIEKLHAYAALRHHEDMRLPGPQGLEQRAQTLAVQYAEAAAWFHPELLALPEATLREWLNREELAIYRHSFDDLFRSRPHILGPREEELLAMSSQATEAAVEAHSLLVNTELRWRKVQDPSGREVEVTSAQYYQAMYSKDRRYRRDAFVALHDSHADVRNTLAATLAGAMHRDWYFARARHYESCLQASLDAENLPVTVYHNLLQTVESHLPLLHEYLALKKRALGVEQIHAYDLHVNLVDRPERTFAFDEARDLILEGIEPFGPEYGAALRRAFTDRWIDVYENRGKMSGAYNMGTYLAPPYVLLNFKGTFNDVSTLAHELGHAMQSWFAKEHQPPVYAGYPMFTAEVASTAAEIVFKEFMLDRTRDPHERAYLINQLLEDMRGTVFRQTQFAQFDLAAHQLVERGEPITAEVLMGIGREIGNRYYGPDFALDPALDVEALRIPHYYRNFYVYRYATSYCAAAAIARHIREGAPGAIDRWMTFLKTGNSRYALDMLQSAGADLTTPRPIAEALDLFKNLLGQLDELAVDSIRSIDRPPAALPETAGE